MPDPATSIYSESQDETANAEVVIDLAIQLAKDQLGSQFSASNNLESKMATILGFTAVFGALILQTKWHGWGLVAFIPALLTVGCCLAGLYFGRFRAGPDPRQFYETTFDNGPIMAKQQLLSELENALNSNKLIGVNKSFWLMSSITGVFITLIAITIVYLKLGGG